MAVRWVEGEELDARSVLEALARRGVSTDGWTVERVEALRARSPTVLRWLEADPGLAARFAADPGAVVGSLPTPHE